MKTFLVAFMAVFAMQFITRATLASEESELIPADQLAIEDGFDVDFFSPPPPHPHPHPVPHPHPLPPPHPPRWWYECSSEDQYGRVYSDRGRDPLFTQRNVHNFCERHSGTYCRSLGCRRI